MSLFSDFTVLLAVYQKDCPKLFQEALSSVFSNSLMPYELIVVADGVLTKDLLSIIDIFSRNHPLRLLQLPHNVGLANALNSGLSAVQTKYTIRADADDFNYSNRFEILVAKLHEGFDLVGSAIREVDKTGAVIAFRYCPLTENEIRRFARKRNPFNHMTVGFRTAAVIEAGGYPSIHLKEDYALWASLLANDCRVCNLDVVLVDATTGIDMFMRRGGLNYAFAELELQRHLVKSGIKSPFSAFMDGILRSTVFLAPNHVRKFLYLRFLRTQKDKE